MFVLVMPAAKYEIIRSAVLQKLENNLSKNLWYHGVHHTIDVVMQAERIAVSENIVSKEDLFLLKVACLYHDAGFLFTYQDHEAAGCSLAKKELPAFGFTLKEDDDGSVKIESLAPGSPAFKSGQLNKGDKIESVQWKDQKPIDVGGRKKYLL